MARRQAQPGLTGVALVEQVRQELRSGWTSGLTVLTGDDLFHLDAAQQALLDSLSQQADDAFGLTVFGEERVSVATVVSAARSRGMFTERRVVFVRSFESLDGEPDALVEYASSPPQDSYLLIRAPALDLRRKLPKAMVAAGRVLDFTSPSRVDPREMARTVSTLAKAKDLALTPDVASFLYEVSAGDLYRIDAELEKIAAWMESEDGNRVTLGVARQVVAGGDLLSGWEVADAILKRDRAAALAAVARLVQSGDEPIRIVGGLAWRARVMLQAKGLLERGTRPDQVISATRAWSYKHDLIQGMKRYSLAELLRFPAALLEADRTLKSKSIHPRAVLEALVDKLTRPEMVKS
jgi:DNA polymerase-3 subunit delta